MNSEIHTLLIVDDSDQSRLLLCGLLANQYQVKVAINGEQALELVKKHRPELLLLDVVMPGIDGYQVCEQLKQDPDTRDIPVIFLTAKDQVEDEEHGFALGAVDFITKPISPPILLARVKTHLLLSDSLKQLKQHNLVLEEKVKERTSQLEKLQDVTILAMASLAETRENETGNHIIRTQSYVAALARELQKLDKYKDILSDEMIRLLYKSAPLHDIGKVGIPDDILLKPGKLTDSEFDYMKLHTRLGRDAILVAEGNLNEHSTFLTLAREIAYSHQEKWDGSGYPEGLAGEAIPLSARLMAVADVYDALISRRVYKPPMSHDKAVKIIEEGASHHFDPDLVAAFSRIKQEFADIAEQFNDNDESDPLARRL